MRGGKWTGIRAAALAIVFMTMPTWAMGSVEKQSLPSGGSGASEEGGQKPLEVNGQSRNLNMTLVLRNDKDKIKFVKIRKSYRAEILGQTKETTETKGE